MWRGQNKYRGLCSPQPTRLLVVSTESWQSSLFWTFDTAPPPKNVCEGDRISRGLCSPQPTRLLVVSTESWQSSLFWTFDTAKKKKKKMYVKGDRISRGLAHPSPLDFSLFRNQEVVARSSGTGPGGGTNFSRRRGAVCSPSLQIRVFLAVFKVLRLWKS